jgi:hypothetical protein
MKEILTGLLLSLLTVLPTNAQTKSDRDWDDLLGLVQSVVVEEARIINVSGQYVEKDRRHWRTTTYDRTGNKIKEEPRPPTSAAFSGNWEERRVERIFEGERLVEERSYIGNGSLVSKDVWKYDSQGRQSEWLFYYADEKTSKLKLNGRWAYKYDARGNVIERSRFKGCCILEQREAANHDEKGNIAEYAYYNADGSLRSKTRYSYEYDSVGNWIKKTTFSWVTKDGKSFFEPVEVSYRAITYY